MNRPSGPSVNHLVLTVRDLQASHDFYTDKLGFEKCGELSNPRVPTRMWFYRGHPDGHHDLALVEAQAVDDLAHPGPWPGFFPPGRVGINHIAIGYPTREEWLERLRTLRGKGVEFIIRGNHGMTHSAYISDPDGNGIEVLYELPREVWEGDVNAALNYFDPLPGDGEATFEDTTDYHRFQPAP